MQNSATLVVGGMSGLMDYCREGLLALMHSTLRSLCKCITYLEDKCVHSTST